MDPQDRQITVCRLAAGRVPVRLGRPPARYYLTTPSRTHRLAAEDAFCEAVGDADQAPTEAECERLAVAAGLWDDGRAARLEALAAKLDDLRVAVYEAWLNSQAREAARRFLREAKAEVSRLAAARDAFKHLSPAGIAAVARTRVLVGCGLLDGRGRRVFRSPRAVGRDDTGLADEAVEAAAAVRPSDAALRELARTEPFASLWACRAESGRGVFGLPAADLSDDQRALLGYARLYDNVREHPDCPPEDVLADDDALDGWLVVQRRKTNRDRTARRANDVVGEKVGRHGEVFIPVGSAEEARRVHELNDPEAKRAIAERAAALRRRGELDEIDLPDVRRGVEARKMELLAGAAK